MPLRPLLGLALVAGAIIAAPASAAVPHTVAPGESMWTIAAANGYSPSALAAYNGLSDPNVVVLGSTVQIPPASELGVSAPTTTATTTTTTAPATTGTTTTSTGGPAPMGGYTIQPGDTLTALAARSGVSVSQIAYMNGLNPANYIIAGRALKLPTGSPVLATAPAPTTTPVTQAAAPAASPHPTSTTVDSSQIGSIASGNGVSPSLASAVAWQESGFNNGAVSSTGARGVMQVMPGTWDWVEQNLSGPLDPNSATDNIRAGSLYLGRLLRDTGGDVPTAVAAYYQGLGSVQRDGLYDDTKRYVDNVLALQGRFGG